MQKLFTAEVLEEIAKKHQLTSTSQYGCTYWYCTCGHFLDFARNMPHHIQVVLKSTPAQAYLMKDGTVKKRA